MFGCQKIFSNRPSENWLQTTKSSVRKKQRLLLSLMSPQVYARIEQRRHLVSPSLAGVGLARVVPIVCYQPEGSGNNKFDFIKICLNIFFKMNYFKKKC